MTVAGSRRSGGAMPPPRKRSRIDHRRIRPSITYTVPEIAKRLEIRTGTVRSWIRAGLPVIDSDRPKLVHGLALKDWLDARKADRARPCQPGEMYCLRCRTPRPPMPGSLVIVQRNSKTAMMTAHCAECRTRMNRAANIADALIPTQPLRARKTGTLRIMVSDTPPVKRHFGDAL